MLFHFSSPATDSDVHMESFLCLSQPCFRAEETQLIEYYLLDPKPKRGLSALLSWTKTISLGIGDVRTLGMTITNQECKGEGKAANQRLELQTATQWEAYLSWNHVIGHIPDPESKFRSVGRGHTLGFGSNGADHRVHFLVALFPHKHPATK